MVRKPDVNDGGGKRWVKVPGSALADPWVPTYKSDVVSVANWIVKDCRRVATGAGTSCTDGAPMLMGDTPEGVVFRIGEEQTINQWHHEVDATSGQFSSQGRLVRVRTAEIGRHMKGFLDDAVRALEPDGDFFNFQVVGHGGAFVPWLRNTAAFEWRASVRVNSARASGLDVVVVAWHPNANGTASKAVRVDARGPTVDPGVVGIANAKKSLYGGKGWAGYPSSSTGQGRGLRGDEEPAAQAPAQQWEAWEPKEPQQWEPWESALAGSQASDDSWKKGYWGNKEDWSKKEDWWKSDAWWKSDLWWKTDGGAGGAGGGGGSASAGSASGAGPSESNPWKELG